MSLGGARGFLSTQNSHIAAKNAWEQLLLHFLELPSPSIFPINWSLLNFQLPPSLIELH